MCVCVCVFLFLFAVGEGPGGVQLVVEMMMDVWYVLPMSKQTGRTVSVISGDL